MSWTRRFLSAALAFYLLALFLVPPIGNWAAVRKATAPPELLFCDGVCGCQPHAGWKKGCCCVGAAEDSVKGEEPAVVERVLRGFACNGQQSVASTQCVAWLLTAPEVDVPAPALSDFLWGEIYHSPSSRLSEPPDPPPRWGG